MPRFTFYRFLEVYMVLFVFVGSYTLKTMMLMIWSILF